MKYITKDLFKQLVSSVLKKNNNKLIKDRFTGSTGASFKFGVTEDGKYGYVVKDNDGNNVTIPFDSDYKVVLPTNPSIVLEPSDKSIKITWEQTEVEQEVLKGLAEDIASKIN